MTIFLSAISTGISRKIEQRRWTQNPPSHQTPKTFRLIGSPFSVLENKIMISSIG
jgi:hypothetical protein